MKVIGQDDSLVLPESSTIDGDGEVAGQGGSQVVAESSKKDGNDVYVF